MFGALKRRISRTFNRAGELFSGPTPAKQFRNAIVDRDEEKAISLYTIPEGDQPALGQELHPSKPFPSKKDAVSDSPLYLAAKYALEKLVRMLLEKGGDPSTLSGKSETCLHAVCSMCDHPEVRAAILEVLYNWVGIDEEGNEMEKVSLNRVDVDGNTAIHNAAGNGLIACVEKLITLGAIISIVNKNNITCCEVADEKGYKDLALMLELALVFQPEDDDLSSFDRFASDLFRRQKANLVLDTETLSSEGLNAHIEECIRILSTHIGWLNSRLYRSRAEVLLNLHNWDLDKVVREYLSDTTKVLTEAKMSPERIMPVQEPSNILATNDSRELNLPPVKEDTHESESKADEEKANKEDNEVQLDLDQITFEELQEQAQVAKSEEKIEDKKGEELDMCIICGDIMLPSCDASLFLKNEVTEPERRAITCLSNHSFCLSCWSSHAQVQLAESEIGSIPCPAYKCGDILDLQWAPIVLKSQDLVDKLLSSRTRHIADCAGFKQCPIDNCNVTVYVPPEGQQATRSVANTPTSNTNNLVQHNIPLAGMCCNNHLFCLACSSPAHTPCSCSEYLQWQGLVQEELKMTNALLKDGANNDEIANALWVAANTKRCPRCSTAIEKDEGCNHMSCRKCRKEFCWICMQDWSLHSDNTGGYFQCNRFVQQQQAAQSSSNNSNDIWSEERGNAHAEAMRAREKSMKMARFIHHFARYKAHLDSMNMETRMHKETLRRIMTGLNDCREKKLLWLQPTVIKPLDRKENNESIEQASNNDSDFIRNVTTPSKYDPAAAPTSLNDVRKHCVQCEKSVQFLDEGFKELLKTRLFLQWSYAYAYFEFKDSDDFDYANNSVFRRRSRWTRARLEDHRTSFELLQADLESTVETLSDVVARRRLRASEKQIIQATHAAKQKRVELESLLMAHSSANLTALQNETPSRQTGILGITPSRSRPRSTPAARSPQRSNRRSRMIGDRRFMHMDEADDDENMDDLALLIQDLEFAATRVSSTSNANRNERNRDRAADTEAESAPSNDIQEDPNIVRSRLSIILNQSNGTNSTTLRSRRQAGQEQTVSENNGDANSRSVSAEPSSLTFALGFGLGSDEFGGEDEREVEYSDDSGIFGRTAQIRRAEETAALNRAILLSLQDPVRDGSETRVSEANVEILIAMGFNREDSVQALRRAYDNIDLAAHRLLNILTCNNRWGKLDPA